jgi:hypothetical protein
LWEKQIPLDYWENPQYKFGHSSRRLTMAQAKIETFGSLREVKKVASKFQATVVDDKSFNVHRCAIEAPKGFIWSEGDIHELVDETNQPWKPDYADLVTRMNYGIEKCPHDDCEWCNHD